MYVNRIKWARRYMDVAEQVATWSKDPNTKVGAVIVGRDGQILSQGYNGFPRGIADDARLIDGSESKNDYIIHAEMNAIFNAALSGTSIRGGTLVVNLCPCHRCALGIIQSGIKTVIVPHKDFTRTPRWEKSMTLGEKLLREAIVQYHDLETML